MRAARGLQRRVVRTLSSRYEAWRAARRAHEEAPPTWRNTGDRKETKDTPEHPEHADEKTIRRIGEAQAGGISTDESDARFESGENPGGLHQGMEHRDEGPLHARPELEEPQDRKERKPRHEKHMASKRSGS